MSAGDTEKEVDDLRRGGRILAISNFGLCEISGKAESFSCQYLGIRFLTPTDWSLKWPRIHRIMAKSGLQKMKSNSRALLMGTRLRV